MSDPRPLLDLPQPSELEREAAHALAVAIHEEPWPKDRRAALYWSVKRKAAAARSRGGTRFFACLTVAATAWLVFVLLRPTGTDPPTAASTQASAASAPPMTEPTRPRALARSPAPATAWTRIDLGDLGLLETAPEARLEMEDLSTERRLNLRAGLLRAQVSRQDPFRPVVVATPHLRVVVVGTRFDVVVDEDHTAVDLIQGAVSVEGAGGTVLLRDGERIDSADARLRAPTPAPSAPQRSARPAPRKPLADAGASLANCETHPSPRAREACFAAVADGSGLAAENALFRLGLMAREQPGGAPKALQALRRLQERFPAGLLASEAATHELAILGEREDWQGLAARAAQFERRFPADSRVDQVALLRASTQCLRLGDGEAALPALERLSNAASPDLRKTARALLARCARQAGSDRAGSGPSAEGGGGAPSD